MTRTLVCVTVLLSVACGGAPPPPPEPQLPDAQEEAVSATPESDRDSTSEPGEIVAPPPAYGNKIVRRQRPEEPAPSGTR